MHQNLEDIPYGPIRSAIETIIGRGVIYIGACVMGSGFGSMLAGGEVGSMVSGILGSPFIFYYSFLFSQGVWVWPLIILIGALYLRFNLSLWILLFPAVAAIILSFSVVKQMNSHIENDPLRMLNSHNATNAEQSASCNPLPAAVLAASIAV